MTINKSIPCTLLICQGFPWKDKEFSSDAYMENPDAHIYGSQVEKVTRGNSDKEFAL
jgi:hypothetical protein